MAIVPLAYLKKELGFTMGEWTVLSEADKATLKQWAREEMDALGLA